MKYYINLGISCLSRTHYLCTSFAVIGDWTYEDESELYEFCAAMMTGPRDETGRVLYDIWEMNTNHFEFFMKKYEPMEIKDPNQFKLLAKMLK